MCFCLNVCLEIFDCSVLIARVVAFCVFCPSLAINIARKGFITENYLHAQTKEIALRNVAAFCTIITCRSTICATHRKWSVGLRRCGPLAAGRQTTTFRFALVCVACGF